MGTGVGWGRFHVDTVDPYFVVLGGKENLLGKARVAVSRDSALMLQRPFRTALGPVE